MPWGMSGTTGFSGLSAVSTGPMGTGGTAAAPATANPSQGGVSQGVSSFGATCAVCQNPTVRQGLFIFAIFMLWVFWHTHLHSMLD